MLAPIMLNIFNSIISRGSIDRHHKIIKHHIKNNETLLTALEGKADQPAKVQDILDALQVQSNREQVTQEYLELSTSSADYRLPMHYMFTGILIIYIGNIILSNYTNINKLVRDQKLKA